MKKVGIDLSPTRCALVEVSARGRAAAGGEDTRVRSFEMIPDGGEVPGRLTSALRALLAGKTVSRHCWVTLWGVRSSHQLMPLTVAKPSDLEALARREARQSGSALQIDASDATIGVASGGAPEPAKGTLEREVSVVTASTSDIRERLQPIIDAGFEVEGVTTPSLALCSLARRRRGRVPGAADAYVAVMPYAVALAIVRDGLLMFAREIAWGYQGDHGRDYRAPLAAEELAERLSSELRRSFLFFKQHSKQDVSQVLLCGALPGLRTLTAPLIQRLDVEVETLDSLDGIDAAALPEPAERFREQIADLRLAWALSADPAPPVNLLPADFAARRETRLRRRLFGAGMAAALVVSAVIYGYAGGQARAAERGARDLESQVSALEPRVRQIRAEREDAALESARLAALAAFDTQGPRMARVLEALARLAPKEVTLRSLQLFPDGTSWRLSIVGLAGSADPARAQATLTGVLRSLQDSPYVGPPVRPPQLRIALGNGSLTQATVGAAERTGDLSRPTPLPGTTGIEFTVDFSIRK